MKLENKIALITGAGSGIGKAIALEMVSAGAHIAVNDLTAETAETTAHQIEALGREAFVIPADVADSESGREYGSADAQSLWTHRYSGQQCRCVHSSGWRRHSYYR